MLFSFVRNDCTSQRTESIKNNCFISLIYILISSLLFLIVNCVFTWKFVQPVGEFIVITIVSAFVTIWAFVGLACFFFGWRLIKKIFFFMLPVLLCLLMLSWFFLLANLLITPRFYDKCGYNRNSCNSTGSDSTSNSTSHLSNKSTSPLSSYSNQFLECERHYYKKFAWALTFVFWLFLDIFFFRIFAAHYLLRDYYATKYSQYHGDGPWDRMSAHKGMSNYPNGETPIFANNPPPNSIYRHSDGINSGGNICRGSNATVQECGQSISSLYRSTNTVLQGSCYSQNYGGIRNIRMSDADSIIVS